MTRGWQEAAERVGGVDKPEALSRGTLVNQKADLDLLRNVLDQSHELHEDEIEAFDDMRLRLSQGRQNELTSKQREWVGRVADRVCAGPYENLVSSGKVHAAPDAPKHGFELLARPLKPPGRP